MVIYMKVKVTCPKCGHAASVPARQVVRAFRCAKCSHRFVPVRESVSCPKCGVMTILPPAEPRHTLICLGCSFIFRQQKWWLKRKFLILEGIAAVILVLVIPMFLRYRSNKLLAKELRAEFQAWLETLPKVPDSENGMLVILQGTNYFDNYQPYFDRLSRDKFSFQKQADVTFLRGDLTKCQKALDLIYAGLKYEKFMCPTDHSKGPRAEIPNFLGIKVAARMITLKGDLAKFDGKKTEALKEYLNALRLGRTLANERFMISAMIEVAVLNIGLRPLTEAFSTTSLAEEDLGKTLETLIKLHGRRGDFYHLVEADYHCGMAYVATAIIEGTGSYSELGWGYDPLSGIRFSKYIYNHRADIEKYRKVLGIYRGVDPVRYYELPPEAKDGEAFNEEIGLSLEERSLAALMIPNFHRALIACVETEVMWSGAIAMAAIRLFEARNGRLPKNLAELGGLVPKDLLTDPFSGKNLIYRLAGNDFYLYSVGLDGVDGKPVNVSPYFVKGEPHPGSAPDVIFHVPAAKNDK